MCRWLSELFNSKPGKPIVNPDPVWDRRDALITQLQDSVERQKRMIEGQVNKANRLLQVIEELNARLPADPPKPAGTIDIHLMSSILLDYDEDADIFLPDTDCKIYNKADVVKFLKLDEIDKIVYIPEEMDCIYDTEVAYALGLFFADGSCGLRKGHYAGAYWRIVGWKKDCLERAGQAFERYYPDMTFPLRLYPDYKEGSMTNYGSRQKTLYCLEVTPKERHNDGSRGKFIEDFTSMSYSNKEKKIYKEMWGSSSVIKKAFLEGVIAGDGHPVKSYRGEISCHGKVALAGLIDMILDCGWSFRIRRDKGNDNYYLYYDKRSEELAPIPACDDFAAELFGKFAGSVWTDKHALNFFVSENDELYFIEPQTDQISKDIGVDIRFFLGR